MLIIDKIMYNNEMNDLSNNMGSIENKKVCIDEKLFKSVMNGYNDMLYKTPYSDDNLYELLQCIGKAIDKCCFDKLQLEKLNKWFDGYTESEIASMYGVSTVAIHYFLVRACKRIAKQLERVIKIEFR